MEFASKKQSGTSIYMKDSIGSYMFIFFGLLVL